MRDGTAAMVVTQETGAQEILTATVSVMLGTGVQERQMAPMAMT